MKDWFWNLFVLKLNWISYCLVCDRYYLHVYGYYATCRPCVTMLNKRRNEMLAEHDGGAV